VIQSVGFFRELEDEKIPAWPSIFDATPPLTPEVVRIALAAFECGVPVFNVMGASADPFEPGVYITGGPSLVSDGQWVWREDTPHFVRRYGVRLPEAFIHHARTATRPDPAEVLKHLDEILAAAGWR
jgi:hypothetical protein